LGKRNFTDVKVSEVGLDMSAQYIMELFCTRVKVPLPKVLKMLFTCLNGGTQGNLKRDCDVTNQTATTWLAHYKQVIEYDLTTSETLKIGGPGWEVQVDESKFGKVQCTAGGPIGHPVKGVWVLGGVESKNPAGEIVRGGNMFLVQVEKRDAETLCREIQNYVHPGTTIISDCWRGYSDENLRKIGMMHDTVNHSVCFVNEYGTHTNTIEGNWAGLKLKIHRRNRKEKLIDAELVHQMWLRRYRLVRWSRLMHAIKKI